MASISMAGNSTHLAPTDATNSILPSSMSVQAVIVSSILGTVALVSFSVRLFAQRRMGNKLHPEDFAFAAALLVILGSCALMMYVACRAGVGWPVMLLQPVTRHFVRVLLSIQLLWSVSIALVRTGLLIFYRRIFTRKFQIADTILLAINAAWVIGSIIVDLTIFRWMPTKHLSIDWLAWLISMSSLDVAQDLAVLCLPLSAIRTLKVTRKRKVLLSAVFMLGLLCVVASAVRLKYFADLGRLPATSREVSAVTFYCNLWCIIQACCSLTTACLTGWGPLFAPGQCLHWAVSSTKALFFNKTQSGRSSSTTPLKDITLIEKTMSYSVQPESDTRLSNDSDTVWSV